MNSDQKGLTFNYEGALLHYRKPRVIQPLTKNLDFKVNNKAEKKGPSVPVTEFQLLAIEDSNTYDRQLKRSVQQLDTKLQGFGNHEPSVMTLQPGVKLRGPGKTIVGDKVTVQNKITISEYRKLQEPQQ